MGGWILCFSTNADSSSDISLLPAPRNAWTEYRQVISIAREWILTGLRLEQQGVHNIHGLIRIFRQHAHQRYLASMSRCLDTLSDPLCTNHFNSDVDASVVRYFEDFCRPVWPSAVVDEMSGTQLLSHRKLFIRRRRRNHCGAQGRCELVSSARQWR